MHFMTCLLLQQPCWFLVYILKAVNVNWENYVVVITYSVNQNVQGQDDLLEISLAMQIILFYYDPLNNVYKLHKIFGESMT